MKRLPRVSGPIALRRLAPSDLVELQAYRGDPVVGQYQGWTATSDEEAARFLSEMNAAVPFRPGHWFQIAIADAESGKLLGDIGLLLSPDGSQVEIGFTLAPAAQGRGLATRAVREAIALAFEATPAERILAVTDVRNLPSVRLLERLGMRRVDTHSALFRGEPCLEHTYVLSRPPAASNKERSVRESN